MVTQVNIVVNRQYLHIDKLSLLCYDSRTKYLFCTAILKDKVDP